MHCLKCNSELKQYVGLFEIDWYCANDKCGQTEDIFPEWKNVPSPNIDGDIADFEYFYWPYSTDFSKKD